MCFYLVTFTKLHYFYVDRAVRSSVYEAYRIYLQGLQDALRCGIARIEKLDDDDDDDGGDGGDGDDGDGDKKARTTFYPSSEGRCPFATRVPRLIDVPSLSYGRLRFLVRSGKRTVCRCITYIYVIAKSSILMDDAETRTVLHLLRLMFVTTASLFSSLPLSLSPLLHLSSSLSGNQRKLPRLSRRGEARRYRRFHCVLIYITHTP